MKKIVIEICTGTTCHVMGAESLMDIKDRLHAKYPNAIELKATSCLGYCKDRKSGEPPFVKVNNKVVSGATMLKITETIAAIQKEEE